MGNITFVLREMESVKSKYDLAETPYDDHVDYKKMEQYSFSIYIDHYFELNIYFWIYLSGNQKTSVSLDSIAEQASFPTEKISLLHKNQFSSATSFSHLFHPILSILCEVLDLLEKEKGLLYEAYLSQKANQKLLYEKEQAAYIINRLNDLWRNKMLSAYLEFFEENKRSIESNKCFKLLSKRAEYIKSHRTNAPYDKTM